MTTHLIEKIMSPKKKEGNMTCKVGDKCWSLTVAGIKEYKIEGIKYLPIAQLVKIDGSWHLSSIFFYDIDEALHAFSAQQNLSMGI